MREIHVQLRLTASFPESPIHARRKLIEALEQDVGEVGDTGAGAGVMDLWLRVEEPKDAARRIRKIAKRLGLGEWTEVHIKRPIVSIEILCDSDYSIEAARNAASVLWAEIDAARIGDALSEVEYAGIVALTLEVADAAAAVIALEQLARKVGIADRTRVDER